MISKFFSFCSYSYTVFIYLRLPDLTAAVTLSRILSCNWSCMEVPLISPRSPVNYSSSDWRSSEIYLTFFTMPVFIFRSILSFWGSGSTALTGPFDANFPYSKRRGASWFSWVNAFSFAKGLGLADDPVDWDSSLIRFSRSARSFVSYSRCLIFSFCSDYR